MKEHTKDSDCILDDDMQCVVCHVDHSDICVSCGARAYHTSNCLEVLRQIMY